VSIRTKLRCQVLPEVTPSLTIRLADDMLKSRRVQGIRDSRGRMKQIGILEYSNPGPSLKDFWTYILIMEVGHGTEDGTLGDPGGV